MLKNGVMQSKSINHQLPKLRTTPDQIFTTNIFGKIINFVNLPNQPTYVQSRVLRLKSKEPETIDWIESIPKNEIFFDVGANIGIYTMCAGARNIDTYAFEPHAGNYNILCQNISANSFPCTAYCVALSNQSAFDIIGIKNYHPGVADNTVNTSQEHAHGIVMHDLDSLISTNKLPQPQHIKIDIDGHEEKFYQGAKNTLAKCKTILFELEHQYEYIADELRDHGFKVVEKHRRNDHEHNFIFSK